MRVWARSGPGRDPEAETRGDLCSLRGSRPVPCCPLSWHVSGEATGALEDAEKPPRLGRLSIHPDPGRFRRRLRSEFRSVYPGGKRCVGGPAHGWVASVRTHPRLPAVLVRSTHRVESVILLASEARNDRTFIEAGTGLTEGGGFRPLPSLRLAGPLPGGGGRAVPTASSRCRPTHFRARIPFVPWPDGLRP